MSKRFNTSIYIAATLFILSAEILIALFVNDAFVRPFLGDLLATVLVYTAIMSISRFQPTHGIIISLIISYLVEFAQYGNLICHLHLEYNTVTKIILGTSFSWLDMLMYSLGGVCIYLIERLLHRYKT